MILLIKLNIITILCRQGFIADIIPVNPLNFTTDLPTVTAGRFNHHIIEINCRKNREHISCRCITSDPRCFLPHHSSCSSVRHQNNIRKYLFHDLLAIDSLVRIRKYNASVKYGKINFPHFIHGILDFLCRNEHLINGIDQIIFAKDRTEC